MKTHIKNEIIINYIIIFWTICPIFLSLLNTNERDELLVKYHARCTTSYLRVYCFYDYNTHVHINTHTVKYSDLKINFTLKPRSFSCWYKSRFVDILFKDVWEWCINFAWSIYYSPSTMINKKNPTKIISTIKLNILLIHMYCMKCLWNILHAWFWWNLYTIFKHRTESFLSTI